MPYHLLFHNRLKNAHALCSTKKYFNLFFITGLFISFIPSLGFTQGFTFPTPLSSSEMGHLSIRNHTQSLYTKPHITQAPIYQIMVDLDLDLLVYRGELKLHYTNQEIDSLDELYFLLYPNSKELSERHERRLIIDYVEVNGTVINYNRTAGEVLKIPLPNRLTPQSKVEVKLGFKGNLYRLPAHRTQTQTIGLEQILQSIYHKHGAQGGYGIFSYGQGIASMALWYPILAAYDVNGWDVKSSGQVGDRSYFDIAHYDVTLRTHSNATIATSGVMLKENKQGRTQVNRYIAAGVREFSIQVSKDYVKRSLSLGDLTLNVYLLQEHQAYAEDTLKEVAASIRSYESFFGPYPYKELDLAESPLIGGAGGVEFPGLITIAHFLFNSDSQIQKKGMSQSFLKESRHFVIAHEVAHQWWNAVVGSDSRTHPFVDEALANYSAAAHFHQHYGASVARRQIDMMMRLNYHLARLTGMSDQKVDQPTSAFKSMFDYAAIVYGKGALFFWELRTAMGTDALHQALRNYYHNYQFKIAKSPDLRKALRAHANKPAHIEELTKRWLDQTHGDEDIQGISIYQTLKLLMGDAAFAQLDPQLKRWANHRGVDELAQILEQVLKGERQPKNIDYTALTHLLSDLMQEDPQVSRWAQIAGKALNRKDLKPGQVLRDVGREIGKDDQKTGLILESMGLLYDALSMPESKSKQAPKK
jgi:hypothetical protein